MFTEEFSRLIDDANAEMLKKYEETEMDEVDFIKAFISVLDEKSKQAVTVMAKHISAIMPRILEDEKEMVQHMDDSWGTALVPMKVFEILCIELANGYGEYRTSKHDEADKEFVAKHTALGFISGKAIQFYKCILILLQQGYGYVALGLYRSLYELYIISTVIRFSSKEVADSFIGQADTLPKREVDNYIWAKEIDCFREKDIVSMHDLINCANQLLGKNHSNRRFRSAYQEACVMLHPSAANVFQSLTHPSLGGLVIGPLDISVYGPALNSLKTLMVIQMQFYTVRFNEYGQLALGVLEDVCDEALLALESIKTMFDKSKPVSVPDDA